MIAPDRAVFAAAQAGEPVATRPADKDKDKDKNSYKRS